MPENFDPPVDLEPGAVQRRSVALFEEYRQVVPEMQAREGAAVDAASNSPLDFDKTAYEVGLDAIDRFRGERARDLGLER